LRSFFIEYWRKSIRNNKYLMLFLVKPNQIR